MEQNGQFNIGFLKKRRKNTARINKKSLSQLKVLFKNNVGKKLDEIVNKFDINPIAFEYAIFVALLNRYTRQEIIKLEIYLNYGSNENLENQTKWIDFDNNVRLEIDFGGINCITDIIKILKNEIFEVQDSAPSHSKKEKSRKEDSFSTLIFYDDDLMQCHDDKHTEESILLKWSIKSERINKTFKIEHNINRNM